MGRLCSHVHRPLEVDLNHLGGFISSPAIHSSLTRIKEPKFRSKKSSSPSDCHQWWVEPLSIIPLEKVPNHHTTTKKCIKTHISIFNFFLDSMFKMFKNVIKRMFDVLLCVRVSAWRGFWSFVALKQLQPDRVGCTEVQRGGSGDHFYSLWSDPAGDPTHNLPGSGRTLYH